MPELYREISSHRRECGLLRGDEQGQVEDGFGVAEMNCLKECFGQISSDRTACYSGAYFRMDDQNEIWTEVCGIADE